MVYDRILLSLIRSLGLIELNSNCEFGEML
jgi:hypothetical protein